MGPRYLGGRLTGLAKSVVPSHPLRGEVYWVDFSPARGSEQAGRRPAVVISTNTANRVLNTVTIAAVTTKIRPGSPLQLVLPQGRPCPEESAVIGHQVLTIDQSRLDEYIGVLDEQQLESLRRLLRQVWAL